MYKYKYKLQHRFLLEASKLALSLLVQGLGSQICIIGIPVQTAERPQWNTLKAS